MACAPLLRSFSALTLLLYAVLLLPEAAHALWPKPHSSHTGSHALRLDPSFHIDVEIGSPPDDLLAAVQRTRTQLFNDRLGRLVVDRGASDLPAAKAAKALPSLKLTIGGDHTVRPIATEAQRPLDHRDEAYVLTVPADGSPATLVANSTLGLFRGLTTFSQLWYTVNDTVYTLKAPVSIWDRPAYPYRGFMLDTARNYFPVSDIKRTLDACSWVHINTFHWHITDSQSFPLVVPGFTDIAGKGAYSAQDVYVKEDIDSIVEYAGERGIDIVVEIDTPGHTSSISKAHPEHIACAEATPWAQFANEPPAGQLRLATPATIKFTTSLLSAIAKMFPSTMFNTGGDEINANCYQHDAQTQKDLAGRTIEQALDAFTQATHGALKALGKTALVWEEMVLNYNLKLSSDTIALVWISSENARKVADKGFRFIHAASDYFYLDCGAGGWVGNNPNGNSWCDPFKTWQKAYTFNPSASLTDAQASLVLGGESLLWTEQSGPENLDSITWPRAAATAELWWTGPGGNVSAALPRLHELAYRFKKRGVQAKHLQPEWCALRPFKCDLTA